MGALKWIGAGLGWAFGGPIGALIGLGIGSVVEALASSGDEKPKAKIGGGSAKRGSGTTANDITVSLLVLTAAIMKADGKVLKSELNYVKSFLVGTFGEKKAADLLTILRDILQKDIDLNGVCRQIYTHTNIDTRVNILDMLYGVAAADGQYHPAEGAVLARIARLLHIPSYYVSSIYNRHFGDYSYGSSGSSSSYSGKDPYSVLGIDSSATDDEVKKAYRRLAMKYHPDRVENMGEEVKKNAEKQFREINEAYETIKKSRNMA